MRCKSVLCLLMLSGSLFASGLAAANTPAENCSMTMGWEQWKPFQYRGDESTLTGFDIELVRTILNDLGCQLNFKEINWARGIVETRSGKMDMLPHADYADDRAEWAYFSEPYREVSQVLYVKPGGSDMYPFKKPADIMRSDFRMGVGRGVFIGDRFAELMTDAEFSKHIVYIPTDEMQQYKMLHAGRIDGYVRAATAMKSLQELLGEELRLEIHPLPILTSRQHFLFSKQSVNQDFVDRFNASLNKVIESGTYADLESRFLQ